MVILPSETNDTNITCLYSLLWSQSAVDRQRPRLYICIIATIIHSLFWLQLVFYSSLRQKSMQWLYAYLITDILLLLRFFFLFIIHTTSNYCTTNASWVNFICYFEAIFDNYLNILEVYILLALNVCRYEQIAHNRDVYTTYLRLLILAHFLIYLIPLISLIIQPFIGWAQLYHSVGGSCDIAFTNMYTQILNIVGAFALPIILNILVIYVSIRHVHLTSRLRRTQQHTTAREKYHRSLVIQFLVFYTIWLSLWSPNVIVYQFASGTSNLTTIASLLNFIEIALDPIIIAALDIRFQKLWFNLWTHLKAAFFCNRPDHRRVAPIATNHNGRINGFVQQQTTVC